MKERREEKEKEERSLDEKDFLLFSFNKLSCVKHASPSYPFFLSSFSHKEIHFLTNT